jgi:hypothetical protein
MKYAGTLEICRRVALKAGFSLEIILENPTTPVLEVKGWEISTSELKKLFLTYYSS